MLARPEAKLQAGGVGLCADRLWHAVCYLQQAYVCVHRYECQRSKEHRYECQHVCYLQPACVCIGMNASGARNARHKRSKDFLGLTNTMVVHM